MFVLSYLADSISVIPDLRVALFISCTNCMPIMNGICQALTYNDCWVIIPGMTGF